MKKLIRLLFLLGNPVYKIVKLIFRVPFLVVLVIGLFLFYFLVIIPPASSLKDKDLSATTHILDRNGNLLYKIYKDRNRTYVPLAFIPQNVIAATLSAEDAEFYSHTGFSLKGMLRALGVYFADGKVTGGSTITQQLVKNTLLTPEKTLKRKLLEALITIKVEVAFSKDQILEMYLNETPYGGPIYGLQEASQTYFGKNIWDLDLAEAAFLAGLPKSPSRYSPFGTTPEEGLARQRDVLHLMNINGYISDNDEVVTASEKLTFKKEGVDIKAPHFVMYVKQYLEETYGAGFVYRGGLNVYTTLDLNLQKITESAVAYEISRLKNLRVGNGAALVISPKTGEILAMVGSVNYFDQKIKGQVNVLTSLRQPGSSIKPLTYSLALAKNLTPLTIINDAPITFKSGNQTYTPKNYDGKFVGHLTARNALAQSRNIPAVKTLNDVGVKNLVNLGQMMGLSSWKEPSAYGLSLTLGGGDVKLLELAYAYATFANQGQLPTTNFIAKITNTKGETVYKNECLLSNGKNNGDSLLPDFFKPRAQCQKPILDPRIAFLITNILSDNQARTPAFGANSALKINGHPEVAVKTGTSNHLRDNVTLGYSPNYLVATWVGNTDNSPMSAVASGITGASPIWNSIMTSLLETSLPTTWEMPQGIVTSKVCSLTGSLACQNCSDRVEYFLEENQPKNSCNPKVVEEIRIKNAESKRPVGELFESAVSVSR